MSRFFLFFCILSSFGLNAQDFTNTMDENEPEAKDKVLIVPFKSQFLLSEIDRGMVNQSAMEVMTIRRKIPTYIVDKISASFMDSVTTKTLHIDLDAANLSYNTELKKGQINKDPIFKERYMGAKMDSEQLVNFINSEYAPDISIVLTELDLMKARNEKMLDGYEYLATLHYCIFSPEGALLEGNKIERYFNRSEFDLSKLQQDVLHSMSETIHDRSMVYLNKNSSTAESADEDNDY